MTEANAIYAENDLYVNTTEGNIKWSSDEYDVIKYWWEQNPDRLVVEYGDCRTEFPAMHTIQVKAT